MMTWWIFVAYAVGGCAGVLLTALLRTAADQRPDALLPAGCLRAVNETECCQCEPFHSSRLRCGLLRRSPAAR
jgi:hypothetical protein